MESQTLLNISQEAIRQNWNLYKDEIQMDNPFYEMIWKNWSLKFNIDMNDFMVILLKLFIENQEIKETANIIKKDDKTLIIKGLNGEERLNYHKLCDIFGLHHESIRNPKKKNSKWFYVYKPKEWLWEYTARNPYSKSDEYYGNQEKERVKQQKKYEYKKRSLYCNLCDCNGYDNQLYYTPYFSGLYCEDCVDNEYEGTKFDPIH